MTGVQSRTNMTVSSPRRELYLWIAIVFDLFETKEGGGGEDGYDELYVSPFSEKQVQTRNEMSD